MSIVGKDSLFRNSVRWRWARACGRTLFQLSICFTTDYFYCTKSETLADWQRIQEICNNQWFRFQRPSGTCIATLDRRFIAGLAKGIIHDPCARRKWAALWIGAEAGPSAYSAQALEVVQETRSLRGPNRRR